MRKPCDAGPSIHVAAIALGSNLPGRLLSRRANLNAAICALPALGTVVAVSPWLQTDPVGYTAQPQFLNGAALLHTELPPLSLLDGLLAIEQQLGRDRSHSIAKGPRTLDLDLLLYDDMILHTDRLTLPHPLLHERRFVLQPLADIAPGLFHPRLNLTIQQLLTGLSGL